MNADILDRVNATGTTLKAVCIDQGEPYLPGMSKGKPSKHICTLTRYGKSVDVEYTMGAAHRVYHSGQGWKPVPQFGFSANYALCKEIQANNKPKTPELADVLYSLSMDSSACDESFDDWCSNLGYDTDSRKALETYLVCQESGKKLQTLGLSRSVLAEMFQDY